MLKSNDLNIHPHTHTVRPTHTHAHTCASALSTPPLPNFLLFPTPPSPLTSLLFEYTAHMLLSRILGHSRAPPRPAPVLRTSAWPVTAVPFLAFFFSHGRLPANLFFLCLVRMAVSAQPSTEQGEDAHTRASRRSRRRDIQRCAPRRRHTYRR